MGRDGMREKQGQAKAGRSDCNSPFIFLLLFIDGWWRLLVADDHSAWLRALLELDNAEVRVGHAMNKKKACNTRLIEADVTNMLYESSFG